MSYCRNCGKELAAEAMFCPSCGVPPPKGDKYCPNCGNSVSPLAEVCVKCGIRLTQFSPTRKKKVASILLAVFLGYWTWLYTYKRDKWKFWVGLCLSIVYAITVAVEPTTDEFLWVIWFIPLGTWIWAIVDTSIKKREWYDRYA
jgi:RNA polymerase subunit RPABC4/transcription elongation factor Spt4